MQVVDKGLILRETAYKDADSMLTVLTECGGKLSVLARGAKRKSSRVSAAIQLFSYSEFTLYESGGRYTLNEAEPLEMFYGIRGDIMKLSLASYFAEVLEQAADTESINPELLRLGLNSLYALSATEISQRKIKAAFELKAAQLSGYQPNVFFCASCGKENAISSFDLANGAVFCRECDVGGLHKISKGVLEAMRYILTEDIKKLFSFSVSEESMQSLSKITDDYLRIHFDRSFKTNTFYKGLL